MAKPKKIKNLKKELRLFDVFAIATGTTLSAGFFLLPGIAAEIAGPALILAYLIAAVPLIPAMFSIIELATAMPRAGGVYYFLDRTLGPAFGTIGGIGTWLSLVLKVAFALVGMGTYTALFFPSLPITPIAIGLAIALGLLNIVGAKKSGALQVFLVTGLLLILGLFIGTGIPVLKPTHFKDFFGSGFDSILATAGLVYISYVGITKIASLSEEVKNPEKNLPKGVMLSLGTALIVYVLGTAVIVGVLPMSELAGNLAPVAVAAEVFLGKFGAIAVSIAALLAFVSVANAGTLSASRYPLAMSRDHILPDKFRRLTPKGTPLLSIVLTVGVIIAILVFLDPTGIAKLASSFQLLMFALVCLAVIVMRESRIASYDPGFKSPLYPWMQIIGIFTPLFLIAEMGWLPLLFSTGLILISLIWYRYYVKDKVVRAGAIYHIFERLGHKRYGELDTELRGILKEKGLRDEDPFDNIITRSIVIDKEEPATFREVLGEAAYRLNKIIPMTPEKIIQQVMDGTRIGATPVTMGVALPHFRCDGIDQAEMVLVRGRAGVKIPLYDPITHKEESEETVKALFFLVSPEKNPTQHLRILAQIAGRVDDPGFSQEWSDAHNESELKEAVLHDERFFSLIVEKGKPSQAIIEQELKDINIPEGCLVALLMRGGSSIIPKGDLVFEEGDRLTIIGDKAGLNELRKRFG